MTNRNQSLRSFFPAVRACVMLLLLSSWLPCLAQAPANSPEGSWQGTLGAGTVKLRVVLTFTKSSSGEYKGILDSLDQGATIPADKVTLNDEKIRVDFERVNGFYEGAFNQDGSELTGTWTQNGVTQPLAFKRAQANAPTKDEAKPAAAEKPFTSPIDVLVPIAPTAFQADGKTHLVYELHITNYSGQNATLARIETLSDAVSSLARLEQADLLANVLLIGNRQAAGMDKLSIPPGHGDRIHVGHAGRSGQGSRRH